MEKLPDQAAALRRFNRFYTRRIGVLDEGLLGGPLPLSEARVLYEVAVAGIGSAARLGDALGLDAGYLSRILRSLQDRGLIDRRPSDSDGRQSVIVLTVDGRDLFANLNARSQAAAEAMLTALPEPRRARLAAALATAEALLDTEAGQAPPVILRPPAPGDMGWIVHRHGVIYGRELGWNEQAEALTAEIVARFMQHHDPRRERCWIAERDGAIVGSVFLMQESDRVARLRLLYVEADARGMGIGRRLVAECVRFARDAGYERVTLWTNSVLTAARHIYIDAGFRLVAEAPHRRFGPELIGQDWELIL